MMTSTFPTSKSNSYNLKNGIREIQTKREALMALEAALAKRINEFRQLCLKEGELTGQLPIDYPLRPREPIPQVRRRVTKSDGNLAEKAALMGSIMPPNVMRNVQQHQLSAHHQPKVLAANNNLIFPSRPTSTNSTNSSTSTASSSKMFSINDVTNFQPYYEETKPFQMSDFYKYSSKLRQTQTNGLANQQTITVKVPTEPTAMFPPPSSVSNSNKSTRQHQEEVSRAKSSLRFASCDDQIQASVRLIEKSGQKFMEATAKAIAGNPGLAERLNSILPNHHHLHNHHQRIHRDKC